MADAASKGIPIDVQGPLTRLLDYCSRNDWAGFDPYDALNSRLFARTPLSRRRWPRIILTQSLKRLPVNVRPLLGIPREQNPKGLALFLSALVKLSKLRIERNDALLETMVERLCTLRAPETPYWCWGYSFPWQTRTVLVPKGSPNLVCTVFAANALLDVYETRKDLRCLEMAISSADFLLDQLYWASGSTSGFSYPFPNVRTQVHNANFLASALLCRVFSHTRQVRYLEPALEVARCSAAAQADDGSWTYSESPAQQWIDNFHTGYNLCALKSVGRYAETQEFDPRIRAGLDFYLTHFFADGSVPKYFHNRTYPVDAHCVAQSIITLGAFSDAGGRNAALAESVFRWAMARMWDERGYFYYQVLPVGRNKVSYMRWTQAWMLLALTTLLERRRGVKPAAAAPEFALGGGEKTTSPND